MCYLGTHNLHNLILVAAGAATTTTAVPCAIMYVVVSVSVLAWSPVTHACGTGMYSVSGSEDLSRSELADRERIGMARGSYVSKRWAARLLYGGARCL